MQFPASPNGRIVGSLRRPIQYASDLPLGNGIIGLGGDLAWPKPTRPGDTLHVESEILEIVPSRSKPNQALVKVRSTTLNQNGEPVHSFTSKCLVFKRPQTSA
ncbi:MAG: hypothetical protein ACXVJ0_13385 [Candidatus Angelobacter sp.]